MDMDIEHYYIEEGEGEPLILLHGNGEDCEYFDQQMEAYAPFFHVYALDTRGHGQTPRGTKPFTIRQFSRDLLGFMKQHKIKKTHLLGFSDGANIAMVFAIAHPDRVGKLILNGGNLDFNGLERREQLWIKADYEDALQRAKESEEAKQEAELLGLMVNDPKISPQMLRRITSETLVIVGEDDMIREKHTQLIAASIPNAKLAVLPGDHFVANKNPNLFNRYTLAFLLQEEPEEEEEEEEEDGWR